MRDPKPIRRAVPASFQSRSGSSEAGDPGGSAGWTPSLRAYWQGDLVRSLLSGAFPRDDAAAEGARRRFYVALGQLETVNARERAA